MRIGVISDTHGLLRPEAVAALGGVDRIVHAGDIGPPELLAALERIAPVTAVRGNVDTGAAWADLPLDAVLEAAGRTVYVIHDRADLALDPARVGIDVLVFGHSHRPQATTVDGVLWLNPGSAGPRRFRLPVTLARVALGAGAPAVEFVDLAEEGAAAAKGAGGARPRTGAPFRGGPGPA